MDDLTRIKGIGPKTAEELRARGVTSFAQIAGFASTEVPVDVADLLPASRMADWGPQAALYAAESFPEVPAEANSATPPQASADDGPSAVAEPKEAGEQPASAHSDAAALKPGDAPTHVRIRARPAQGFRRAGMRHSKTPVDHPIGSFSREQLQALLNEPNLVVELVTLDTRGGEAGGAA